MEPIEEFLFLGIHAKVFAIKRQNYKAEKA
jgi:hypothetical protein